MSVDVFGRKLGKTKGDRGPPGFGFKVTSDGQYDIDNKKLCNIATPKQSNDAVNLDTLQKLVRSEILSMTTIMKEIGDKLDDLKTVVDNREKEVDEKFTKQEESINKIKRQNRRNMQAIKALNTKANVTLVLNDDDAKSS